MPVSTASIADLPVDLLIQKILNLVSLEDRASGVSLVSKEWHALVRQCSHRPSELRLRPEDFSPSFMAWHLTDTKRLRQVASQPPRLDCSKAKLYKMFGRRDYQESVQRLLSHLAESAPALESLEINPSALCWGPGDEAFHSVLPRLGGLQQLRTLVLRDWRYTMGDVFNLPQLSALQNLQSLDFIALQATAQPGSTFSASEIAQWAGSALENVLPTLAALTRLHLTGVDCQPVLPGEEKTLTNIKSLVHDISIGGVDVIDAPPDVFNIEGMTGLERLWMRSPEEEPVWLTSLGSLRELTYTNSEPLLEDQLLISDDAVLTKLALHGHWGCEFEDQFPLATLRNLVELTIDCFVDGNFKPELPVSWSQLTDLTSLTLCLKCGVSYNLRYRLALPIFKAEFSQLRSLEASMEFEHFLEEEFVETVQWLFTSMPRLTRLGISVHHILVTGLAESEAVKWLEGLCWRINWTFPGVSCEVPTVTKGLYSTGYLVLTCPEECECTEEPESIQEVPSDGWQACRGLRRTDDLTFSWEEALRLLDE